MTIQEAIKSNRPFKRPYMNYWIKRNEGETITELDIEDILADDWIIKNNISVTTMRKIISEFMLSKSRWVERHTNINNYYIEDDELSIMVWNADDVKRVYNQLEENIMKETFFDLCSELCPYCIYHNVLSSCKEACSNCSYGKNHGICGLDGSLYFAISYLLNLYSEANDIFNAKWYKKAWRECKEVVLRKRKRRC